MDIALIGYGEVGRILAEDLRPAGHAVRAFDTRLSYDADGAMREHAKQHDIALVSSHADAVRGAELVISAVTASQTVVAAEACVPGLSGGYFLDFNSASPGAKVAAAKLVEGAGARFVEGAVMAPVPPYRIAVPLLLGGPRAAPLLPTLEALGFAAKLVSAELGVASATKMCRSVVIKGLEALLIEGLTAARHYGVEAAVISSLNETFPSIDWDEQATYNFQRVIEHGRRRSEEMRESAETVREAGLEPWAARAVAERQGWIATLADSGVFGRRGTPEFARSDDWRTEADRILSNRSPARKD